MASPQLEDGYLKIANEIIDKGFLKCRIPGEQMLCLWLIIRKTYGYNKQWDAIAGSQFVKATGLKKQSVHRAIKELVEKNIVSKNADGSIIKYRFNKNYKTWKVSAKKLTVSKSADRRKQKRLQPVSKKVGHKRQLTKNNITKDILEKSLIDFDVFWKSYPRKVGKQECLKIWLNPKKKKGRPSVEEIVEILEIQKISLDWTKDDGQFIPHPSTWLNQGRWDDELRIPREGGDEFKPTTYAQAQDAERRVTARWLLKEMKRDKQKGSGQGTGEDVARISHEQADG